MAPMSSTTVNPLVTEERNAASEQPVRTCLPEAPASTTTIPTV
jgi:hypothetical protein